MSNATQLKAAKETSSVINDAVRARAAMSTRDKVKDDQNAAIQSNPFFQIVFKVDATPEQKQAELAKALTFEGTKQEMRERIKQFEAFKEYLAHVREEMASEIIKLTNTETFSELQQVYKDLDHDLRAFDESMKPLVDILDAMYVLRTNGQTFDALQEIHEDRKRQGELKQQRDAKGQEISVIAGEIRTLTYENANLGEQKSFFGFGGVKQDAREKIARNTNRLTELQAKLATAKTEIEELNKQASNSAMTGEFAEQKKRLRELLDISSDAHRENQEMLVRTALNFVNTAKERVGSVRIHLGKMDSQIENLFDANNSMTTIHALLNESIKDAAGNNQKLREELDAPTDGENSLAKVTREQKKQDVEMHIAALSDSAADAMGAFADLTTQSIRIKTMKDANTSQSNKTRTLHTQGIAGVADRLSTVLQAVSAAALGESSAMARDTLSRMADNTNQVAQKEVLRVATGGDEINRDLEKALQDLGEYGEVLKTSTEIRRTSLTEMQSQLQALQTLAQDTKDKVNEAIGVNADVQAGTSPSAGQKPAAKDSASPFKFGS